MDTTAEKNTTVFIVDDSAPIRERLAGLLSQVDGVKLVGEAESPASAIAGILDTRPDAVVLDVQLLGGNGLEVLRKVHPQAPAILFVVLTSYPTPQYRNAYISAGAHEFLDKTAEFARVAQIIGGLHCAAEPVANTSNDSLPAKGE